ncbi:hypothetical protein [Rhizosaccharibacter radicis]|uniref:Uncharacterized protein n=1 Tax=Rhizosaccharibacter radicis TaxID=2782605 RepID=A0ABT1VTY6_9PROT|nr:hypothetical protein [Acetobacteraceae bacterium KSS12]
MSRSGLATAAEAIAAVWSTPAAIVAPGLPTREAPTGDNADGADRVRRLSQHMGEDAMRCVSAAVTGEREQLLDASVAVLRSLLSIWAATGVEPAEIWAELHKRERLGSLLMQLDQAHSAIRRRSLKPWQLDSTKLP